MSQPCKISCDIIALPSLIVVNDVLDMEFGQVRYFLEKIEAVEGYLLLYKVPVAKK